MMKFSAFKKRFNYSVLLFFILFHWTSASTILGKIDLTESIWILRLDTLADWENDTLFKPGVDINKVPVNIPTGGWETFENSTGKLIHIPATVEQYFWNRNGNPYGVDGNYVGVSWFSTSVDIPKDFKNKSIILNIESVRMRAEIFVNRKLVGYDLVNGTPFKIDISDAIVPGKENKIDFRITDPNGNFNWKDSQVFNWGRFLTIPSHGFGGVTGKVEILAGNYCYIEDVFVKNKPLVNEIDVEVTSVNLKSDAIKGELKLEIREHNKRETLYTDIYPVDIASNDTFINNFTIKLDNAKLWSPEEPNLYDIFVTLKNDKDIYTFNRRFGFRWFEVRDNDGDKQFFLNGKRIVLVSAISWGFWPISGITPTDSLARKQIVIAKKMGLNMINIHRQIGQDITFDLADELGLLVFEEPGGNQYPFKRSTIDNPLEQIREDFYMSVRNERLARMIIRDRNHPSLIIYNLHNERGSYPVAQDSAQMQMAHQLDETRIILYNSSNRNTTLDEPNARFKLHMRPYDQSFYNTGWWDCHHAGGPGVYHDNLYKDPEHYHRQATHSNEIIFWGEEGAIGTPPRLQLIRDEILKMDVIQGWQSQDYLEWYNVYNQFLQHNGFSTAFPTVDDLTRSIGNNSLYYQGRIIENIKINNTVDGYVINGWESIKLENHSGVVDNYRNPKGDIDMLARYCQPLYIAVKIRDKVLPVGDTATIDFFIVNEKDVKGEFTLQVNAFDENSREMINVSYPVNISGGNTYGELLLENVKMAVKSAGYIKVNAALLSGNIISASGSDDIFAVRFNPPHNIKPGMVADTSGILNAFLQKAGIDNLLEYNPNVPEGNWLIVGAMDPPQQYGAGKSNLLEWVYNGNNLIIVNGSGKWLDFLQNKEVIDYRGLQHLGKSWFGGNYFVKKNKYFTGLPVNCAFNWEYQCLATYNKYREGMRVSNGEILVGCVADHKKEVYSAFSVIPAGRGKIIITTLDILSCIKDLQVIKKDIDEDGLNASINSYNTSLKNKSNIVGQQLLLNILKYCSE